MTNKTEIAVPAVDIADLKFAYPRSPLILDIQKFSVSPGERVFLYGSSGSGKTTLLGIMAGMLTGWSGSLSLLGRSMRGLSGRERDDVRGAHIGYIFQMFNLIPYLTVIENICVPCHLNPLRGKRASGDNKGGDLLNAAKELCAALGIAELSQRRVTDLSVGQQQRVAAARALIGAPELIIADEPTSALDNDHREKFLQLLFTEAAKRQSTIIFVSHDQTLKHMFDRNVSLFEINRATQQSR